MKLRTEIEHINYLQQFAFKLRKLYFKDFNLFNEIIQVIPYSVFINNRDNLDITYANNQLVGRGPELEKLVHVGASYLPKISNPVLLQRAKHKASNFDLLNDSNGLCCYLQQLTVNSKPLYFYSNKMILSESQFFNISSFTQDMGLIGKVFDSIFEPLKKGQVNWIKFQTLTKQEKRIISLLSKGYKNKEIAEILFISTNTIKTHMKNIHKKLDTNRNAQIIKLAIVLEVL